MNTLVTKLPQAINNENLIGIDSVKLPFYGENILAVFKIQAAVGTVVRVIGNGCISDASGSTTANKTVSLNVGLNTVYVKGSNVSVEINKRGSIDNIIEDVSEGKFSFNLSDVKYLNPYQLVSTSKFISGDVCNLSNYEHVETIRLTGPSVFGDMKNFPNIVKSINLKLTSVDFNLSDVSRFNRLTTLIFESGNGNVSGDISNLSSVVSLKTISVRLNKNIVGNVASLRNMLNLIQCNFEGTSVIGSASEFKAAQVAAGRNSGTCVFTDSKNVTTTINFAE